MTSRRFPLATVLRVRAIEEEVARGRVAVAAAGQNAAGLCRAQAVEAYDDAMPTAGETTPAGFLAERSRRGALAAEVQHAVLGVVAADEVAAGARQHWSTAAMRLSALERLADRNAEILRRELLAADQRTGEETAAAVLSSRAVR